VAGDADSHLSPRNRSKRWTSDRSTHSSPGFSSPYPSPLPKERELVVTKTPPSQAIGGRGYRHDPCFEPVLTITHAPHVSPIAVGHITKKTCFEPVLTITHAPHVNQIVVRRYRDKLCFGLVLTITPAPHVNPVDVRRRGFLTTSDYTCATRKFYCSRHIRLFRCFSLSESVCAAQTGARELIERHGYHRRDHELRGAESTLGSA
jgi:hypothetical protein